MSESTAALLQTVREGLEALAEELAAGKSCLLYTSPSPRDS